ncbi:MAG: hypothetical protein IIA83_10655 [Thaumarchaeota archaeon]|nr:hypothetical protein [Nitrososphaerota archaeon]
MSNQPPTTDIQKAKNGMMQKVRIAIYLLVVLYSGYAITLGTTGIFNHFDKMIMSGLVSVLTIPIFVWLSIEFLKNRKSN